jgi:hypothetical protein
MTDRLFSMDFAINLKSQYTHTPPDIHLKFDNHTIYQGPLLEDRRFEYQSPLLPAGTYRIALDFSNKDDSENLTYGKDMMVGIDQLLIENQKTNFGLYSNYRPDYSVHWYRENLEKGVILEEVLKSNYLGWNGTWYLDIELPIFRWIHKVTSMGWLI